MAAGSRRRPDFARECGVGMHPEHRDAQKQGRDNFYSDACILVCPVVRETDSDQRRA